MPREAPIVPMSIAFVRRAVMYCTCRPAATDTPGLISQARLGVDRKHLRVKRVITADPAVTIIGLYAEGRVEAYPKLYILFEREGIL
jgi:hypothetical protein